METMAIRKILKYPDPFLRKPTEKIDFNDPDFDLLSEGTFLDLAVKDCFDTLYGVDKGAALAANQIGLSQRLFVINKNQKLPDEMPLVIVNPTITSKSSETAVEQEGCLSFPGISVPVRRSREIELEFQYTDGGTGKFVLSDWIARVVQHEVDHLDGKLFVDFLSIKKRTEIANTMLRKR